MRDKGYSEKHTQMWLDSVGEQCYYELKVPT